MVMLILNDLSFNIKYVYVKYNEFPFSFLTFEDRIFSYRYIK
jgi:hypothetical protein